MVKEETRIQLAIKEILEEEIWRYLKTKNNFEKVLSIASLIDPFDEGPEACYENCRGMCFGCYDGYKYSLDWRASYNLRVKNPFSLLTEHELEMLSDAMDQRVHVCDEWCSNFICYRYIVEKCAIIMCHNLFIKKSKNLKYCSTCRNTPGVILRQNYKFKSD